MNHHCIVGCCLIIVVGPGFHLHDGSISQCPCVQSSLASLFIVSIDSEVLVALILAGTMDRIGLAEGIKSTVCNLVHVVEVTFMGVPIIGQLLDFLYKLTSLVVLVHHAVTTNLQVFLHHTSGFIVFVCHSILILYEGQIRTIVDSIFLAGSHSELSVLVVSVALEVLNLPLRSSTGSGICITIAISRLTL